MLIDFTVGIGSGGGIRVATELFGRPLSVSVHDARHRHDPLDVGRAEELGR